MFNIHWVFQINKTQLETKFEMFRITKRFLLHMQEVNQGNLHYRNKKMSEVRILFSAKNILSYWTIIWGSWNFQVMKLLFKGKFATIFVVKIRFLYNWNISGELFVWNFGEYWTFKIKTYYVELVIRQKSKNKFFSKKAHFSVFRKFICGILR